MAYSSIGNNNQTGTDRELFATKFSTDVLRYFMDTNIMKALITNKTIDSGKAENFPIVGEAAIDTRSENNADALALQTLKATERTIVIDSMTVAHSWITDLDKAMAHYDSQSAQAESIGRALAKKVDEDVINKVIEAANIVDQASATTAGLKEFSDDDGKYTQVVTGALGTGDGIYNAAVEAVAEYADKDAVGEPVFVFRPTQYFQLLNNAAQTGLTWVNDPHAQSGKVPMLLGKKVHFSPRFPASTGLAGALGSGDVGGLLFAKESVGCLELMGVSTRIDYIPEQLSNLIVGKMAVGYGVLNHKCAIAIKQS